MNTLKGALSVIIFEVAWWLIPPNHDPAFLALSAPLQAFILVALAASCGAAIVLFMTSLLSERSKGPES